jgi:hypothetical protein
MANHSGFPKGSIKLAPCDRTLASGFGPTRNQHDGMHKNAREISFPSDSPQTENYSNLNDEFIKRLQIEFFCHFANPVLPKAEVRDPFFWINATKLDSGFQRSGDFSLTHPNFPRKVLMDNSSWLGAKMIWE